MLFNLMLTIIDTFHGRFHIQSVILKKSFRDVLYDVGMMILRISITFLVKVPELSCGVCSEGVIMT